MNLVVEVEKFVISIGKLEILERHLQMIFQKQIWTNDAEIVFSSQLKRIRNWNVFFFSKMSLICILKSNIRWTSIDLWLSSIFIDYSSETSISFGSKKFDRDEIFSKIEGLSFVRVISTLGWIQYNI